MNPIIRLRPAVDPSNRQGPHYGGLHRQRGVTLIEILITLLVLAVGLLGLAALQGLSLQTGQVAYQRSQAVNIAYEVADFARANRSRSEGWIQGRAELVAQNLAQARLTAGSASVALDDNEITVTVTWSEDRLDDLDTTPREVEITTEI